MSNTLMAHSANDQIAEESRESVTTHETARMLGISVTTVLNMIERGQLPAWRTPGGHRRIARIDVERAITSQPRTATGTRKLQVMVVEDDEFLREAYRGQFESWNLSVDLRLCADGVQAMLEIGRVPPDLLVTDLRMPEIDGFSVVRTLTSDARYAEIDIVVISGLSGEEIVKEGGLPKGVVHWPKPVPFPLLQGYIEARISRLIKEFAQ